MCSLCGVMLLGFCIRHTCLQSTNLCDIVRPAERVAMRSALRAFVVGLMHSTCIEELQTVYNWYHTVVACHCDTRSRWIMVITRYRYNSAVVRGFGHGRDIEAVFASLIALLSYCYRTRYRTC